MHFKKHNSTHENQIIILMITDGENVYGQTTVYGYSLFTHCSFDTKKRSIIKRPTDSTTG